MMKPIVAIAINTFKESVRNKILYNILILAIGLIVFAVSIADWSVFERVQVMEDMGLATMSITGLLMAVFIGVGLLGREIATKTVYMIISQPVSRSQFIIGKFFGLLGVLLANFTLMSIMLWIVILYLGGKPDPSLLSAVLLTWMELAVLVAAAIFFSSWSTPILSAIFTLGFFVAGHLNDLISVELVRSKQPALEVFLRLIYYLLPNLEHFNIRTAVVYGLPLPAGYVAWAFAYGLLYMAFLLILSCVAFRKRDL
jgi:Cu-processing system permease protein